MSESAPSLFRLVVLATDRKRDGMKEECLRITDRDVAELVSKIELQTDAKTARQRERGAGEQTGEVDDVESVSEIEDVGLNAKLLPVGLEQDRAERRVDRCGRANTPLRKVHVSDDPGTVLGQCLRGIAVEFDRQPAAVVCARCPNFRLFRLYFQRPGNSWLNRHHSPAGRVTTVRAGLFGTLQTTRTSRAPARLCGPFERC